MKNATFFHRSQLYAYLDHSVDEGQLYKRRSKKANVFHLKRKVMPIV